MKTEILVLGVIYECRSEGWGEELPSSLLGGLLGSGCLPVSFCDDLDFQESVAPALPNFLWVCEQLAPFPQGCSSSWDVIALLFGLVNSGLPLGSEGSLCFMGFLFLLLLG